MAGIVMIIIGAAVVYIMRERKKGVKCIGCSSSGSCCNGGCNGDCNGDCNGNCNGKYI